jgi:C1A family cysteine protease
MKYSKRYLVFFIILLLTLFLKFGSVTSAYEGVGSFRGADLKADTWNPLIAASVNDNLLSLVIDNKEYTNEDYPFYMDDNLNILVPVAILRDALNCSARVYNGNMLLVEKHSTAAQFTLGSDEVLVNGEMVTADMPFAVTDDTYFVSLGDLSDYLEYSFTWNVQENLAVATDTSGSSSIVPTKYDLREKGRAAAVANQGSYGTCWAFAAMGALESTLLPEETAKYSVDHMSLNNGFNLSQKDGGEYTMAMAYLASWKGPVYEADDPYGDGVTDSSLTAVKHVQEMQIIDGKDYEKIKEAVFKYGGVQTSIYNSLLNSLSESEYYNRRNNAYCYIGTEKPNHDVVIIGWDDTYPRENFNGDLEGDGAFICQNSWGEKFGDDGVFYISYYDSNIGTHNVVYTRVDDVGNYDHIYQSDLCGWIGQIGYLKEGMYGANIFTTEQEEELTAASFYATGKDSQYELYVVRNFEDESSFDNMVPVASGKLNNAGYYTIDFNQGIQLDAGERYAIVLYITTPGATRPMAIEYRADELTQNVVLDDGESYISSNGNKWVNINTEREANLCIKAFTKNR